MAKWPITDPKSQDLNEELLFSREQNQERWSSFCLPFPSFSKEFFETDVNARRRTNNLHLKWIRKTEAGGQVAKLAKLLASIQSWPRSPMTPQCTAVECPVPPLQENVCERQKKTGPRKYTLGM